MWYNKFNRRWCHIKRGDIIITATVLLVAVILGVCIFLFSSSGEKVVIKQDNKVVYELPLSEDKEIKLSGNTIEIKGGKVDVTNASCKNQICVKHKKIENKGENIVCLPNKVIVEIK